MDARKSVRHVPPYRADGDVPQKCTLLGTYEQMGPSRLDESRAFWDDFARHIHIDGTRVRKGERLCAVSLVKRFAWPAYLREQLGVKDVRDLHYSDTATVAASLWLPPEIDAPESGVNWRKLRNWSGQWLHWSQPGQDKEEECPPKVWKWIQDRKNEVVGGRKRGGAPTYYAILMADADRLGDKLTGKGVAGAEGGEGRSEKVSKALTEFALNEVREIIEARGGELIYSGGDDTMAVAPTETVVACAMEVQRRYADNWKKHFRGEKVATISAGVAIVHHKEDLRFAMNQARRAEHLAKGAGRDALAVTVCRRSGEHTSAVVGWDQADDLQQLVGYFAGGLSDRWTYKLRALLPTFQGMPWESFAAELRRLLGRLEGDHEAIQGRMNQFALTYRMEMTDISREKPLRKRPESQVMADFVVLCQTASFLARGRDAR